MQSCSFTSQQLPAWVLDPVKTFNSEVTEDTNSLVALVHSVLPVTSVFKALAGACQTHEVLVLARSSADESVGA